MPKLVVGSVHVNDRGFEEYRFSSNPYVHRTEGDAIQQAKNLARKIGGQFAVFRLVATIGVEDGTNDSRRNSQETT